MTITMTIWEKKKEKKKKSPSYGADVYPGNSTLDKWALGKEFDVYLHTTDQISNDWIHTYAQADHIMIRI